MPRVAGKIDLDLKYRVAIICKNIYKRTNFQAFIFFGLCWRMWLYMWLGRRLLLAIPIIWTLYVDYPFRERIRDFYTIQQVLSKLRNTRLCLTGRESSLTRVFFLNINLNLITITELLIFFPAPDPLFREPNYYLRPV